MKHLAFALWCFFHALKPMKGGDDMKFAWYLAIAIVEGQLTWDQIVEKWKPFVKWWLDKWGVGTDGVPVMPEEVPAK